jgi:hypothetical protein
MKAARSKNSPASGMPADTTSVEGLRDLFTAPLPGGAGVPPALEECNDALDDSNNVSASQVECAVNENGDSAGGAQDEVHAEATVTDISDRDQTYTNTQIENIETRLSAEDGSAQSTSSDTRVSRTNLVNVLESFVNLIKHTPDLGGDPNNPLLFDPTLPPSQKVTLHVDDKTAEVEELRCLLVEAQETIIRLLTDRVEDRARISRMETELKLLPDLQTQADRALAVAMNTDDFRKELTRVKFELERVRLARVRNEIEKNRRSWWRGMRGWFFKTKDTIITNSEKP